MFLIEDYLNEKNVLGVLSDTTIQTRRYELNRFVRFCKSKGMVKPHEIDEDIIIKYFASLNISKMTKSTLMFSIQKYFDFLLKKKIILKNYMSELEKPKFIYPDTDYLEFDEVEKLFQIEADMATPKTVNRNLLLMNLFFTLCLRANEATGLKFNDIRLDQEQIWVKRKGGQIAKIPLNKNIINQFSAWNLDRLHYNGADSDYIFLSTRGKQLTTRQARYVVSNALKRAGIKKRKNGCHILRHSGATYRLNKGESIKVIQYMLGHVSLATTEKYLHFNENEFKNIIKRSPEL